MGKLTAGILAAGAVAAPQAAADVLVVGNSMEVGSAPHLRASLAGTGVDVDASPGRTSREAVRACLAGGAGAGGGIPAPRDPNARVPRGAGRDAGRPGAPGSGAERAGDGAAACPARLPAPAALLALGSTLRRVASPVAEALRDARMAATTAAPEPVLGAPP